MRRWFWVKRYSFLCLILGFLAGFVLVYACLRIFTFKSEIGPSDLLNVVSAVVIALVLQNIAQRQFSNSRVEKDLLIGEVREVITSLKELHRLFLQRAADVTAVNEFTMQNSYRHFANSLNSLEKLIQSCDKPLRGLNVEGVKRSRLKYRKSVLGGGFPRAPYDVPNIAREETLFRSMTIELSQLVFAINRR